MSHQLRQARVPADYEKQKHQPIQRKTQPAHKSPRRSLTRTRRFPFFPMLRADWTFGANRALERLDRDIDLGSASASLCVR